MRRKKLNSKRGERRHSSKPPVLKTPVCRTMGSRFAEFLKTFYGVLPEDLRPTEVPGYWELRKPCGGRVGGCREPIHAFLFNEGPIRHTIRFEDCQRINGRFASEKERFRTWIEARKAAGK